MEKRTLLSVEGLKTYCYTRAGVVKAVDGVSFTVNQGDCLGIVGESGCGKTMTCNSITRLIPQPAARTVAGKILFEGEDVTGRKPFQLVRRGICYVPDDRRIFSDLTVDDNLGIVYRRTREWDREKVYDLFPALRGIKGRRAGVLSGGEKAMLAVGRALMSGPKLLLLDEPTEGLAPLIVRALEAQILRLKEAGISILLSEQNLKSSLRLIDRAYIIDNGRIRYQGTAKELENNEEIRRMHLMI